MQYVAKIVRHRHHHHKYHYMNDVLKSHEIEEDAQFKIVFSHPDEYDKFKDWVKENGGEYKYNKEESKQEGEIPHKIEKLFCKEADEEICFCDVMTYYLMHVAGYKFYSTIHPYKGEVYLKEVDEESGCILK